MKGITYTGDYFKIIYLCDNRSGLSCGDVFRGEVSVNFADNIDRLEANIEASADFEGGPRTQFPQTFHEISKPDKLYR